MTIPDLARFNDLPIRRAADSPQSLAVVFGQTRWSYRELEDRVEECARALLACGIARGDRIATLTSPRPEYLVIYLATARVGAIWVGLNPVQQLEEYRHILGDCRPSILFAFGRSRNRDNHDILRTLRSELPFIGHFVLLDGDDEGFTRYDDFIALGRNVADRDLVGRTDEVLPGDPALIVYTSGSTGRPKGALLTQNNIAHCAALYCRLWPLQPLRVICNLPVTHVACCIETVAFSLAAGGTIVFQEQFDAADFLEAIQSEGVNWIPLVPTMFQRILALPGWERYDTSSLRVVLFGGAAMPADMIEKLKLVSRTVVGCWGMTETTTGVTFTGENDNLEILCRSVGKPAPTIEVAIMGTDGNPVPPGETGEVVVRGPCVFAGYFGMPEATREAIDPEGWLHSGDLGQADPDGNLYIVGRIKEMFKSGGYNVYPREVEIAIEAHEAVSMAAVVSVADPIYQEVGYAFVLREAGQPLTNEAILRHCRGRLANYKVPKRFFIRDSLPMLANGKIDRAALRTEAIHAAKAG